MVKGGQRCGAGRKKGSGKFGESTKAMRIPISLLDKVQKLIVNKTFQIPFFQEAISAGFPSPANDYIEKTLDLNELLIKHPEASFFLRVAGSSMINAGIHHNDILLVDRSVEPAHGKIVIAVVNGELTVKRLHIKGKDVQLLPENESYQPIKILEGMDLHIWGVVTNVIHPL